MNATDNTRYTEVKKIKLLAAVLLLAAISACAKNDAVSSENNTRIVWGFDNATADGELYTDSSNRLNFIDFHTMQSALLCSKPNCNHKDEGKCSSFGMGNHPILYGGKLYFFDVQTNFESDEVIDTTTVYKADTDGTNRAAVCEIKGLALPAFDRMLKVGDKAYFPMVKYGWDDAHAGTSGYNEIWLCGYDFSANTVERIEKLYEGWTSGSWIYGLFDGRVIFTYAYSEEKVPFDLDLSEMEKRFISVYKSYDIESGAVDDLELPKPLYVGEGYYVYEKDGGTAVICENKEEILLPDFPADANGTYCIVNGKLFHCSKQLCADLTNGKMYALSSSDGFVAYSDGSYILKEYNNDSQKYEYSKIAESDYIRSIS